MADAYTEIINWKRLYCKRFQSKSRNFPVVTKNHVSKFCELTIKKRGDAFITSPLFFFLLDLLCLIVVSTVRTPRIVEIVVLTALRALLLRQAVILLWI